MQTDTEVKPGSSGMAPSEYAVRTFLPEQPQEREGVALCLSGGGFRAALFHLGALRRLNETGVLSKIDTIAAVSGGSILAAHLAQRIDDWPAPGAAVPRWDPAVAEPFRAFVRKDLRTGAILKRMLPWNWLRSSTAVRSLEASYAKRLTGLGLNALPERPRYVFSATDLAFGVNWVFERGRVGDYQLGYVQPPPDWPAARAVAASSAFPPVFNPLPVRLPAASFSRGNATPSARRKALKDLRLSDGGIYDNLGLEPVWDNHAYVLVSDGGATFDVESDRGLFKRLFRYTLVQGKQVSALRRRWLISNFIAGHLQGTYWSVGGSTKNYAPARWEGEGYDPSLVDDVISEVRTDLDAFSEGEVAVLENHGYAMATVAIDKYVPELATADATVQWPHPEWLDEGRVREALRDSHKRKLLGRR